MTAPETARVDFYLLEAAGDAARRHFACRLAEKAYRLEHTVCLAVPDLDQARVLDDLLWTFRDGSFVPHEVLTGESADAVAPVTIAFGRCVTASADLLINLTDRVPENTRSFPRVAEIVTSDEERRSRSRRLFADYRALGHSLETRRL